MKAQLVFPAIAVCCVLFVSLTIASEHRPIDDIPTPQYYYPDTNFTFQSYCLPTIARTQVMANNHLYVANGTYMTIYEIQSNGLLRETCCKMTSQLAEYLDHDGEYFYICGQKRIEIYDGTNYTDPALIGRYQFNPGDYLAYLGAGGDSLFCWFWADSNTIKGMAIIDVHDRQIPLLAYQSRAISPAGYMGRPYRHGRYLYMMKGNPNQGIILGVVDLQHPSGNPTFVDSLDAFGEQDVELVKISGDRLYLSDSRDIKIYDLGNGPTPTYRGVYHSPALLWDFEIYGHNDHLYMILSYSEGYLIKVDADNPAAPYRADSVGTAPINAYQFRASCSKGELTYALVPTWLYNNPVHHGVYVVDWQRPPGQEIVQQMRKNDFTFSIEPNGNALYVADEYGRITVLDVSDKTHPIVVPQGVDSLMGNNLKLRERGLLATDNTDGIILYDVSAPLHPTFEWEFMMPDTLRALRYDMHEDLLVITFDGSLYGRTGLMTVDMSDPSAPNILYCQYFDLIMHRFNMQYPLIFIYRSGGVNGIAPYDITDPANPINFGSGIPAGVAVIAAYYHNDYVYVLGQGLGNSIQIWWYTRSGRRLEYGTTQDVWTTAMANEKIFFHTYREWIGPGMYVWDIAAHPTEMVLGGYFNYDANNYYNEIKVDYPYVYISGGRFGGIITRYDDPLNVADETPPELINTALAAYPNPFNSAVSISIKTTPANNGRLEIFDILGSSVRRFDFEEKGNSSKPIIWDGRDEKGQAVSSGLYFVRYTDKQISETAKLVLLR
jgi:hypothetical protein